MVTFSLTSCSGANLLIAALFPDGLAQARAPSTLRWLQDGPGRGLSAPTAPSRAGVPGSPIAPGAINLKKEVDFGPKKTRSSCFGVYVPAHLVPVQLVDLYLTNSQLDLYGSLNLGKRSS